MNRPEFSPRTIYLIGPQQAHIAVALIPNLPIDPDNPLEIVIREKQKGRKLSANARYWAGPLSDIAKQAWVQGRQYSAEVWHEMYKREYLPEDNDPELAELAKEGYCKWSFDPMGERILVGSTTQLTKKGFARYLQQVEAYGASLGVHFTEAPGRYEC